MDINELLRAEIDLPDDAPHVEVMNLLGTARSMYEETRSRNDRRTIDRVMERLTARIVPQKLDGRIDPNLLLELINIGNEIEAVNAHRSALYERASAYMQRAVEAGMSQAEVARIVGVDRSTVRSAVNITVEAHGVVTSAGTAKGEKREGGPRRGRVVTRTDGTKARLVPRQKPVDE